MHNSVLAQRVGTDPTSPALSELAAAWRSRAADLRRWASAEGGARALEQAADELETALATAGDELVGLEIASSASGYSADHLRRLARDGEVPSIRRGRRLFFRRADLPRKPASIDAALRLGYDAVADARRVAARRTRGT